MIRKTLLLALLPLAASAALVRPALAPFHCQVPCGIYGDRMRIDMLMEDAATIEKAMTNIETLGESAGSNANQLVRWVVTKDQHAQAIQETVASYWLAQRIKAPKDGDDAAKAKYHAQLSLLHGITVAAMKCKQTTDAGNVAQLRKLALDFSATYFSEGDLKHIHEHHGSDHK